MTELKVLHVPYIKQDVFKSLLKQLNDNEFSKAGGNSKCAIIDNFAILKTGNIPGHDDSFAKMIEKLQELKNNGVNVVPVLGYCVTQFGDTSKYNNKRYDKGYIVQEKASGSELLSYGAIRNKTEEEKHDSVLEYLKMLRKIPQEHFDKWVADYKSITDQKVMIDPSKESNFFYDEEKGFSFIDLNFFSEETLFDKVDHNGHKHHASFILYTLTPFKSFLINNGLYTNCLKTAKEHAFANQVAAECFEKNLNSLKKIGVTEEDVIYTLNEYRIPVPSSLQTIENENIID